MGIRVALHHRTTYRYDRLVTLSPQTVRLRPAAHCRTPVTGYSLSVRPSEHFINWQQDPHGNFQARLVFPNQTRRLEVEVDLLADLTVINPFDFFLEEEAVEFPFAYAPGLQRDLLPFCETSPQGPRFENFLAEVPRQSQRTIDFLVDVNRYVHDAVRYLIRLEPGVQSAEETLTLRSGSCRDSAWLIVCLLRRLGLAARFVSGYLIQLKPDTPPLEGPAGAPVDFTDLHAWAEVYLPGAGWIGLDPTSGLLTGEGHLPLAATPEPALAAPISGCTDECEVEFDFAMSVQRIEEAPRVTKPYSDEQWDAIQRVGRQIDAELNASDVRLTMGGEPTFVSIDDMDGAEWNTAALGADKRRLAGNLFRRLADRFAVGPLLHYGQGKWYPGESLPRWALACYWRKDGAPIWRRPELVALDAHNFHVGGDEAEAFVRRLARRLHVSDQFAVPAYEDVWYYLWKERRLPTNVDPLKSPLDNPEERARLARVFDGMLGRAIGYALPLRPSMGPSEPRWVSGHWFLRDERMYLIPGDSPMGFRLPLDSLPWAPPEQRDTVIERDPFAPRGPLGAPKANGPSNGHRPGRQELRLPTGGRTLKMQHQLPALSMTRGQASSSVLDAAPEEATAGAMSDAMAAALPSGVVRTAVCVEARDGLLHVFMPPVGLLEDYLDLVEAVEDTAAEMDLPVRIEGYAPPDDYRLNQFKVTPDPGVIEVNIHPSRNWEDLTSRTLALYEEARLSRLGTEKFMLDGRHTGTGGGNHVVLGGATPADSPLLRRPDLLRSMLAYWNNRPSLSYLFSGLFIGPTSQAPRIDEARNEALYELETAFSQLPEEDACPPWLVDRVLRHLLVDLTGNTHRAEFCIDKLFSPDSASGRLGLLELRALEMPPHPRMSLTQQLLLRSLVAWFWGKPYRQPLVRWGTTLHDRFVLPHFVAQDFAEVLADLRGAGYPLCDEWFQPHHEFRFPLLGEVAYRGVHLELRQAIEPWHVLGEEATGSGTARYVDSSVERLQVKVSGSTDPRYVVTCNGRSVPLHPTGTPGEAVAGVRYRAWQPPSCLHPTIGVHTPLVFDVVDLWSNRSIGGCTWHVSHPGGRSFDRLPVNAFEAESRRAARFFAMNHRPGPLAPPASELNRDYPLTLDLRRPAPASARQS